MENENTPQDGTANSYNQISLEPITLTASNTGVTTTNASTLFISGAPAAGTNQTITNAYALFVDSGSARFDGFIINTNDEITYGDGGSGNITATSANGSTHDPESSTVFLKAIASSTDTTYHWNLSSFTPLAGTMLHLIFDKEDDTGITGLQVNFGSNNLYSGNGKNDTLTFSTSGQSASLIFLDSAWRIINTGATVA